MTRSATLLTSLCLILMFTIPTFAQPGDFVSQTNDSYEYGDWIGYSCHRFVNSVAFGEDEVYFATTGGITRYDYFQNKWNFPWTVSNGLPSNNVLTVAFNINTNTVWCATDVGISYFEIFSQRWYTILTYHPDDVDEHVISIGFTDSDVWFEKKSGIIVSLDGVYSASEMQIDWFGHLHTENQDLPMLFMSDGYYFDPQGVIHDTDLREYPVTGYWFDRWGNLWISTWGLGAAKADVRTLELSLLPFGLFHPKVSAIQKTDDTFWIGSREPDYYQSEYLREQNGVSVWNPEDDSWHYTQAKYNTGFYSDQINALSLSAERTLLATDQGLSEFLPERQRWLTYDQTNGLRNAHIYDVVENNDYIYIGTTAGVDRLPKSFLGTDSMKVKRIAYNHLRNVEIYDLELQGDNLWAGTNVGAYLFNTTSDSGQFFEGDFGPGTFPVIAVAFSDSMVWFGSSRGLDGYNLNQNL